MIKVVDMCCGCAVPSYPCRGSACPNRNVKVHVCDECEEELGDVYYSTEGDEELCEECLKERFKKRR